MRRIYCYLLVLFSFSFFTVKLHAEKVLVYGNDFYKSTAFHEKLNEKGFQVQLVNDASINTISVNQSKLLIISGSENLHPQAQIAIDRYLKSGGNVIISGSQAFNYAPTPKNFIPVIDFSDKDTYSIIQQKRKSTFKYAEPPTITPVTINNRKGLEFSSTKNAMSDVMVKVSLAKNKTSKHSVLTFTAKGSVYMDLLAIEIVDKQNENWCTFVELTSEWDSYSVSLADFIPEKWSNKEVAYPLLKPENISDLYIGVNLNTLWKEKAMSWGVADIALAENENKYYSPSSRINALRIPFFDNNITLPEVFFAPMSQAKSCAASNITLSREETYPFQQTTTTIQNRSSLYYIPASFVSVPGTQMGTDANSKDDFRHEREKRIIPIFETFDNINNVNQHVARVEFHTGGRYSGAAIGLFGLLPNDIVTNKNILNDFVDVIDFIRRKPIVAGVNINTTKENIDANVVPKLKITLKNPLDKSVSANLICDVADGVLKNEKQVTLPPNSHSISEVELGEVPEDFSFQQFKWKVMLSDENGTDVFEDIVDIERSMLFAFRHLINSQKIYPDGRISNHYFGDAYGVRAMAAYLDLVEKQPERLDQNLDIWNTITIDAIKKCVVDFTDMLVERQRNDGALPMGYSEHIEGYNVADGGQMAFSIVHVVPYIKDAQKRQSYEKLVYKFADWAETFYIDEAKSDSLQWLFPQEAKKGNIDAGIYGLAQRGNNKNLRGRPWVGSCILPTQIYLANVAKNEDAQKQQVYKNIAERNIQFNAESMFNSRGYYQAEAYMWAFLFTDNQVWADNFKKNFDTTFVPYLLNGTEYDMFEIGSRRTLNALSMIYYMRFIENKSSLRAALLKYVWTFGSNSSFNGMELLAATFPKPVHGESLSASKYASLSSVWAMELLKENASLFENAKPVLGNYKGNISDLKSNKATKVSQAPIVKKKRVIIKISTK